MFQKVPIPNSCSYVVKDKVSSSHIYHSLSSLTHILRYMYMFSFSSLSIHQVRFFLVQSLTHSFGYLFCWFGFVSMKYLVKVKSIVKWGQVLTEIKPKSRLV